jgi:hypothetical protein
MHISMKNLKASDVNQLYGLTLNIAYAIYVEGWQWFDFPGTKIPHLLLDAPLEKGKIPNRKCARYIGDDYYVLKDLPEYNKNLTMMVKQGKKLVKAGYKMCYLKNIEEEIRSSNHLRLLHCSADKRCRAIVKFYIDNPEFREKLLKL